MDRQRRPRAGVAGQLAHRGASAPSSSVSSGLRSSGAMVASSSCRLRGQGVGSRRRRASSYRSSKYYVVASKQLAASRALLHDAPLVQSGEGADGLRGAGEGGGERGGARARPTLRLKVEEAHAARGRGRGGQHGPRRAGAPCAAHVRAPPPPVRAARRRPCRASPRPCAAARSRDAAPPPGSLGARGEGRGVRGGEWGEWW